jgi:hypothetical protein
MLLRADLRERHLRAGVHRRQSGVHSCARLLFERLQPWRLRWKLHERWRRVRRE